MAASPFTGVTGRRTSPTVNQAAGTSQRETPRRPFIPPEPSELTGAVLCGFALGWAILGALSLRFTDQPQRWAWTPAVVMASVG